MAPTNPGQRMAFFFANILLSIMKLGAAHGYASNTVVIIHFVPRNATPSERRQLHLKTGHSEWQVEVDIVAPTNPGQGMGFFCRKSFKYYQVGVWLKAAQKHLGNDPFLGPEI